MADPMMPVELHRKNLNDNSFICADIGQNAVTMTVIDNNGNAAICTSMVSVADTSSPVAVCKDIPVNLKPDGLISITPSMIDNGSFDNCTVQNLSLDKTLFTCADTGINIVVLTVKDQSGNTDTCHAKVTVGPILIHSTPNIVGMDKVCPGLNAVPYSVNTDPDIVSYQWSYSGSGAAILGNGTANVSLDFAPDFTTGKTYGGVCHCLRTLRN